MRNAKRLSSEAPYAQPMDRLEHADCPATAAFAVDVGVAELFGATSLGIAFGFGQIAFSLTLGFILLRV